jgi:hypothetical protein
MSKYNQRLSLIFIAVLSIVIISCGKDKPKESDSQNDKESMGAIGEYALYIQKNYSQKKDNIEIKRDSSGRLESFSGLYRLIKISEKDRLAGKDLILPLIQKESTKYGKSVLNTSVNIDNIDYNSKICCFKSTDEASEFYQKLFKAGLVLEQYRIEKIVK